MEPYRQLLISLIFLLSTSGVRLALLPCDNDIYCYGDILHTVQRARLYKDSKTFVDMRMKFEPYIVQGNYNVLIDQYGPSPGKEHVQKFVDYHFDTPGWELEKWEPTDWTADPKFLSQINDTNLKTFASELNSFWKVLGRRIRKDVAVRSELYSMTYVSNPLIVPGGRFNEFYYWDQFWILKGLLHCEMTNTVKGMLENLMQMVNNLGFIPNGGRIYYQRSHPPLLIPMIQDYYRVVKNATFLQTYIETLDSEFEFWMTERTANLQLNGKNYTVARYNVELGNPRPEAYNPDYDLVAHLPTQAEKEALYMHLKTAAESGLDFSSRWFIPDDPTSVGTLLDTKTRFILPVDLNTLIYRNARIMAEFHKILNNTDQEEYYQEKMEEWEMVLMEVFWNESRGCWFDYDTVTNGGGHKTEFYPGNILPLILNLTSTNSKIDQVLDYLDKEAVLHYPGGIPSSKEQTGEQWDFPNAWAPHVHWFIESLEATGFPQALKIAQETAQKWVTNNYFTYMTHNKTMFEKYDVQNAGSAGGGGEYDVVVGFGWSNGVVLDLLQKYGDTLTSASIPGVPGDYKNNGTILQGFSVLLILTVVLPLLANQILSSCSRFI